MQDFIEIDFLPVETAKSGDAIAIRYRVNGQAYVHVVDGGFLDTGDQLVEHISTYYGTTHVDHLVLTHTDQDHVNGLRKVIDRCTVGRLWMNRPWDYAEQLIDRFETYNSVDALRRRLKTVYAAAVTLEELATEKKIPISPALQGTAIGAFTVLAPSLERYLDLIVESEKTPEVANESVTSVAAAVRTLSQQLLDAASMLKKALWGEELFPASGTSSENEMSVVQMATVCGKKALLTGDTGREGLMEAAAYAVGFGVQLPGLWTFQVPHHGGRHNVNSEVLDLWLGKPLISQPEMTSFNGVCSSAEADKHHPKKVVVRAILHRGGHFSSTEGHKRMVSVGIQREGWTSVPQAPYPDQVEE